MMVRARALFLAFVVSVLARGVSVGGSAAVMPPVSDQAFRVDPSTGALTPLEQIKEKSEDAGSYSEYRYLQGAHSSVVLPGDQALQFVIRVDGGSRTLQDRRIVCHFIERLRGAEDRRYRTRSRLKMEQEFADVVFGLDPKKPKNGTLVIALRAPGALPAGEYAVTLDVCGQDGTMIGPQYGAFRVE